MKYIWTILWLLWIAAFFAIEIPALLAKDPDASLSDHIKDWFHVRDKRPTALTWVLRGVLLAFLVWLTGHLEFGWWPS